MCIRDSHYTFAGDQEVTVNIFANAAQEAFVPGIQVDDPPWGWANHPDEVMRRATATVNDTARPNFDAKDPYPFYYQLADGFGWEGYRAVMTVYNDNHAADSAARLTNQQKKDLWLERWSETTGHNLTDYMVNRWGLEVSQASQDLSLIHI